MLTATSMLWTLTNSSSSPLFSNGQHFTLISVECCLGLLADFMLLNFVIVGKPLCFFSQIHVKIISNVVISVMDYFLLINIDDIFLIISVTYEESEAHSFTHYPDTMFGLALKRCSLANDLAAAQTVYKLMVSHYY